jgi:hypothetical protein
MSAFGGKAAARQHGARCLEIISGIPILVMHQDGAKRSTDVPFSARRKFLLTLPLPWTSLAAAVRATREENFH